jgi:hypothetical protein
MATVTPGEENITSAPLARTFAVALTAADANKTVLTLDLRDYSKVDFQYVGTIPAGNIGFAGGLRADAQVVNNLRVLKSNNLSAVNVIDTADVYFASRQAISSSFPAFASVVPAAAWTGVGTLYIRVSR